MLFNKALFALLVVAAAGQEVSQFAEVVVDLSLATRIHL
jgi:hypothetical protein